MTDLPEDLTYEQAVTQLQEILSEMQGNSLDIDRLTAHIQRASALLNFCQDKLTSTEAEVQAVLQRLGLEEGKNND
ncbi:MAG: exodeoxyribonuclease VII small subunit [Bacteroidetes bacterium]|nr:exodeoxyribonuclease VII small subunit [Bacteroidota bacterium]MDA0904515.1 exodeoxyribonuclease VII small subunit [Bacteroidota bacterium]MDA1242259.1 exodeoxyribonuclease VII small subunit [Bacteroidota bacterium]